MEEKLNGLPEGAGFAQLVYDIGVFAGYDVNRRSQGPESSDRFFHFLRFGDCDGRRVDLTGGKFLGLILGESFGLAEFEETFSQSLFADIPDDGETGLSAISSFVDFE